MYMAKCKIDIYSNVAEKIIKFQMASVDIDLKMRIAP